MFVDFQPRRRRRRYLRLASLGRPAPGAARRPSGAEDGRRAAIKASRAHSTPVSDIYPPAPDVNVRQLLCELPAENYYRGHLSTSVTVRVTVRETV